jgi:hypothetical protein
MQMKAVTTFERFITLPQDGFAVFLYYVTSGTKECRVLRAGILDVVYSLFGTELFQLSHLVFSSGHSVAAATSSSPCPFLMFHGLPFSEPHLLMILDV